MTKRMKRMMAIIVCVCTGCSAQYVDNIKLAAPETLEQAGFEIIGYLGYKWTRLGGCVWYTMKRKPDTGIMYQGCVSKWGDEYHIYNLSALDAIGGPGNQ